MNIFVKLFTTLSNFCSHLKIFFIIMEVYYTYKFNCCYWYWLHTVKCIITYICAFISFKVSSYLYQIQLHDSRLSLYSCNKRGSYRDLIEYNFCLSQTHFKCNNSSFVDGQVIRNANKSLFCVQWSEDILPFTNINNQKLLQF